MNLLDSPVFLLGFLSLFHIVGGSVVGATLRNMRQAGLSGVTNQGCLLVWGVMFGGLPLLFGLAAFREYGDWWLLPTQITILIATILIVFLLGSSLREMLGQESVKWLGAGGFLAITGMLTASILMGQKLGWWGAVFGLVFVGAGVAIFVRGVQIALREFAEQTQFDGD